MNIHTLQQRSPIQSVIFASAVLAVALHATVALARAPELRNVNVRGLEIGATTILTIDGADLLPNPRVYLDEQPLETAVDPQSTPTRRFPAWVCFDSRPRTAFQTACRWVWTGFRNC